MELRDTLKIATGGLLTHKSRTSLTILGIVIGIASIMLVLNIGQGAQTLILGQIQSFGPTNLFVLPGRISSSPSSFAGTLLGDSLKQKDFDDLGNKANVPDAVSVMPIVFGSVTASYGSQTYNTIMLGSVARVENVFSLSMEKGMFYGDSDIIGRSEVVVLGHKIATELFGGSDPVGQKIKIKNKSFRVVGVLANKGQSFIDFDTAIIAPYTSVQQYVLGIRYFQRFVIEASSVDKIPAVQSDVTRVLRLNHNITDPAKDDFTVETQQDVVNTVGTIINILTLLLSSVAAISLVVGGVGIMNIMLVSVTERTREIGLRKALGATDGDILRQFLYEAVMLTLSGGVIGILLGTILGLLMSLAASQFAGFNLPFSFSLEGAVLGVTVAMGIGLVFGIFPARQAAKKSPIEALRYE